MSAILFEALPLPHYIRSGYSLAGPGRKHPERRQIGEFDLIVVKKGGMYIGEEGRAFEVSEGHALLLRPDRHHYPTEGCREQTSSFWLHFQTQGEWRSLPEGAVEEEGAGRTDGDGPVEVGGRGSGGVTAGVGVAIGGRGDSGFRVPSIELRIPQFVRLADAAGMYGLLHKLVQLERDSHLDEVRWQQQMMFQEVLRLLAVSGKAISPKSPSVQAAERAASYLRLRYREPVTAEEMGDAISFHPVYIARCMKLHYGCAPMVYLMRYRLEQAKRLLLQTDLPIRQIAEEVGFREAAYFTVCFRKEEGCTPRAYRRQYGNGK